VAGGEHLLEHPRDGVNVGPVRSGFHGRQAREVRNVPVSKDDDRVARSDRMALEVRVANGSDVKRITKLVPAEPATLSSFPGVPVLWPCSCHRAYLC
jgi:hypothetical protein